MENGPFINGLPIDSMVIFQIYGNMDPINIPQMLAYIYILCIYIYIYNTWILWAIVTPKQIETARLIIGYVYGTQCIWRYWWFCHVFLGSTSSTAQGGGGSFRNRKPIGEVGCCESGMAKRIHWWTERCLRSPLCLSLSLTIYLPIYLSSVYLSLSLAIYLSLSLFHLVTYLPIYLSTYYLTI